ncbi:MAG: dicarboxylate/amino acid:cation symporter [Acidobacteriia bacterium]|nr:dicarboxylate/amino acid:cation symporter [Terriglobia bacterium]
MRMSLTWQIMAALAAGALVGWRWPAFGLSLEILATIFIRLVLVIIAPLIFSTLVVGIAGQGDLRKLGSLAFRTFGFFIVVTTLALTIAFALANLLQPGRGVATTAARMAADISAPPTESFWIRLVPRSFADAMARGDVLQVVVFSIIFAVAVSLAGPAGRPILDLCRSLAQVMYRFTDMVMMAAPVGVFGAAAALVSRQGLQVGTSFVRLIAAVYLGLGLLLLVFYPLLALLSRIPLRKLYQAAQEPIAVAFATSSASGALPKAMESMEAMGVPRSIVSFTMGTGLNFNPSGSTVFIGVASLFIFQAFRIPLTLGDQLVLFGTLFVASKGIGGVPRSALVVIAAALPAMGLSPEVVGAGVALLLGIDPLLDMPRTAVNTAGNCLASALVARWQGALPGVQAWKDDEGKQRNSTA